MATDLKSRVDALLGAGADASGAAFEISNTIQTQPSVSSRVDALIGPGSTQKIPANRPENDMFDRIISAGTTALGQTPPGQMFKATEQLTDGKSEDLLPIAGQIVGSMTGAAGAAGTVNPVMMLLLIARGGTLGAATGEILRQTARKARGRDVTLQEATKEVVQTGALAGASELVFGPGGPASKMLITFGKKLGLPKFADKIKAATNDGIAKFFNLSTGRLAPDDIKALVARGPEKILKEEFLGIDIPIRIVDKVNKSLNLLRSDAQEQFAKRINPLLRNKNLAVLTDDLARDFDEALLKFNFVDDAGNPIPGVGGVQDKAFRKLMKIRNDLFKKPSLTFQEALVKRQDLDSLIKFNNSAISVTPRSTKLNALLVEVRNNLNNGLERVGGEAFTEANAQFATKIDLFDNLSKVMKNPSRAENTLENFLKQTRFTQEQFKQLDDIIIRKTGNRAAGFFDELQDFTLAQKFKSESPNFLRFGIIGGILGLKALPILGPGLGTAASALAAFKLASPRGAGETIKAISRLHPGAKAIIRMTQNIGAKGVAPLIAEEERKMRRNRSDL